MELQPADFIPSYIEVLAGLLVFGITLPSILIQIPARNRAIRDRHARKIPYPWVKIRSPWRNKTTSYDYRSKFKFDPKHVGSGDILKPERLVGLVVLSIIFLAGYLYPPFLSLCRSSDGVEWWCRVYNYLNSNFANIAYCILVFDVVVTALFIGVLISYTKERILLDLANRCRKQARNLNRRIDKTILESIGELGEYCDAGQDKEGVLDTLSGLTNLQLSFDSWAELTRAVRQTVVGGNERNYIHAMNLLQTILRTASHQETEDLTDKEIRLADMLSELENVMIQAFTLRNQRVTAAILTGYDELALQNPDVHAHPFLRLGKAALDLKEIRQTVAVVDKFHTKIMELLASLAEHPRESREEVHVFLGLLAYLWHYGDSARQHTLRYINRLLAAPGWDETYLNAQLLEAKSFFRDSDVIETADYLEKMIFEMNQWKVTREFLNRFEHLDGVQGERVLSHYSSMQALANADVDSITACGVPRLMAHTILEQAKFANGSAMKVA